MYKKVKLIENQRGMASILVTMIMIIVITIIVVGFAQISIRQQRNVLDSQLNSEAIYAAKSGINNAESMIITDINKGKPILAVNTCNSGSNPYESNMALNTASGVKYTCVLVNPTPNTLIYSPLIPGRGQTVPLFDNPPTSPTTSQITKIVISWQEHGQPENTGNFSGCPQNTGNFPPASNWPGNTCTAGVLQVDIVPASGWTDNKSLIASQHSIFLEPTNSSSGGTASISSSPQGQVISGNCSASGSAYAYSCYAVMDNLLPASQSTSGYYLHLLAYYESSDVSVTAYNSAGAQIPQLYDAQAVIDSTGKASDILQRIQERVGINPVSANNLPPNALQGTNSICKQFTVRPGVVNGPGAPGTGC